MNREYQDTQIKEASTWCIEDPVVRQEKLTREIVRYPYMSRQMGLHFLDTSDMEVLDIGGGPVGLSSIIPCKRRQVVDPLTESYSQYFDTTNHVPLQGEHLDQKLSSADLIIVTNALDHFEDPVRFMQDLVEHSKPGSYFAHFHAINNAITHPHEAHVHNVNPEFMHKFLDTDYETVWEQQYPEVRYGWVKYNGKIGQPAFTGLYRRVTGYGEGK